MPAFAKPSRRDPEEDDPIKLDPNSLSLEGLQRVYRNARLPLQTRMRAMMAAIPYESSRLGITAVVSSTDFATLLDQRIARMKAIEAQRPQSDKLIEAQPQADATNAVEPTKPTNENGGGSDARLPPPIPDRRYRRF